MPTCWAATPTSATSCSGRSDPGPAAHGVGQHRRQPGAGPGRDRLPARRLRAGRGDAGAVRTPAGRSVTQNGFTELGAQSLNLNVAAADDQLAAHAVRPRPRGRVAAGHRPHAGHRAASGLAARVRLDPAGRSRRHCRGAPFAAFTVYGATPQPDCGGVGLRASNHHRRRHAALPALRRRHRTGTDNHALNLGVRLSW